jgi:hypothetical protein
MKGKKTGGKVVGSKNYKTKQWEQLGEAIITTHAERFNNILNELDEEKFADMYCKILEYFKPKHQRAEVTQHTTIESQSFKIGDQEVKF